MNHLIVFAHPNPHSFNGAIRDVITETLEQAGHPLEVRDLYRLGFDPVLSPADLASFGAGRVPEDVKKEQELVTWADHLVFIYPVWWYDRPAILKGWVDRVLAHNFAYGTDPETGEDRGFLVGKQATSISTFGSTQSNIEELGAGAADWSVKAMTRGTLHYCGIAPVAELNLFGLAESTPEMREQFLAGVRRHFSS